MYFRNKPAPFDANISLTTQAKKCKKETNNTKSCFSNLHLLQCCLNLLQNDPDFFKDLWNWSLFLKQQSQNELKNNLESLYINHIVAILSNMTSAQLAELNKPITAAIQLQFEHLQNKSSVFSNQYELCNSTELESEQNILLHYHSQDVTNIEGVLLPIFNEENYKFYSKSEGAYDKIVKVDSTKVNLRSIALGISSGKAICLSGAVGSGKTTLVEYLARKTGRICPKTLEIEQHNQEKIGKENEKLMPNGHAHKKKEKSAEKLGNKRKSDIFNDLSQLQNEMNSSNNATNGFLRIQLGDQTDSKMLLGQYRCTDVPGEFIWLPGVLTQVSI